MVKKYLVLSILIFSLFACKNSKNTDKKNSEITTDGRYTEIIDNKLVYELINQVLSKNNLFKNCEAILDRKTFIIRNGDEFLLKKIDTVFSENDKKFIVKQYQNGNWFILNQNFIKDKKVIKLDTTIKTEEQRNKFWEKIRHENNCIGYLSVPLFNHEKNMAVIECSVFEENGTFLYKKSKNNEWELYRTLQKLIE